MDRILVIAQRMIAYGALISVAGIALIASVIFFGAGAVLLAVGLTLVILGLLARTSVVAVYGILGHAQPGQSPAETSVVSGAAAS